MEGLVYDNLVDQQIPKANLPDQVLHRIFHHLVELEIWHNCYWMEGWIDGVPDTEWLRHMQQHGPFRFGDTLAVAVSSRLAAKLMPPIIASAVAATKADRNAACLRIRKHKRAHDLSRTHELRCRWGEQACDFVMELRKGIFMDDMNVRLLKRTEAHVASIVALTRYAGE